MKNKSKSLREIILLLCTGIVFLAIIVFAAIGVAQLDMLLGMIERSSESENQVIKDESEDLVWEFLLDDVIGTIDSAARETDGELWTLRHDYIVLGKQVEDVFIHPDRYQEVELSPLSKNTVSKYVPQLLFAEWADQSDDKNMSMIRKLACLTPMMEQIIEGNDDFTTNCYIALPCGITLALDNKPEDMLNPDGSSKYYDATKRDWYRGAVSTGKPYFTSVENSFFHKTTGMGSGFPIYVNGELVAVLHGFTRLETLQDRAEQIQYSLSEFTILVSDEGQLIYSPNTSGELAMDENLSKDLRKTSNPELKQLIDYALSLETSFEMVNVDGKYYYACYAPIKTLGWTQIMFISCDELDDIPLHLLEEMDGARDRVYKDYVKRFRLASLVIIAAMAVLIFVAVILASVFSKRLVTLVDVMTERVTAMTGDDMDFKMESVYKTGDEIEVLANSFSGLTDKLKAYLVENAAITAQKERIDAEMALSSKIQDSMLPRKFPPFPDRSEFELFVDMKPAREVGGDFYDFYFIDDDHLALVIGDVSGKGITAAHFMEVVW